MTYPATSGERVIYGPTTIKVTHDTTLIVEESAKLKIYGAVEINDIPFAITGNMHSFSFNKTLSAPPTGNQLRMNNLDQTAATKLYFSYTTTDGRNIKNLFSLIKPNQTIYLQDYNDANYWQSYKVTANPVDTGTHIEMTVTFIRGGQPLHEQRVDGMVLV